MSHTHDGTQEYFTETEPGVFTAAAEDELGQVVIRVPPQHPDTGVTGIRFVKIPWNSGKTPEEVDSQTSVTPAIHFAVEATAGTEDGVVPFDPSITLEVPYNDAIMAAAKVTNPQDLRLGFFEDELGKWKTFGRDRIFGHVQAFEILEDRRIGRVSCIRAWADPHVGWCH